MVELSKELFGTIAITLFIEGKQKTKSRLIRLYKVLGQEQPTLEELTEAEIEPIRKMKGIAIKVEE